MFTKRWQIKSICSSTTVSFMMRPLFLLMLKLLKEMMLLHAQLTVNFTGGITVGRSLALLVLLSNESPCLVDDSGRI